MRCLDYWSTRGDEETAQLSSGLIGEEKGKKTRARAGIFEGEDRRERGRGKVGYVKSLRRLRLGMERPHHAPRAKFYRLFTSLL